MKSESLLARCDMVFTKFFDSDVVDDINVISNLSKYLIIARINCLSGLG